MKHIGRYGNERFLENRNVFITGCTGLLGSHLTGKLVDRQANVVGLVRDLVPKSNLVQTGIYDEVNIVRGCVEDFFTVESGVHPYGWTERVRRVRRGAPLFC